MLKLEDFVRDAMQQIAKGAKAGGANLTMSPGTSFIMGEETKVQSPIPDRNPGSEGKPKAAGYYTIIDFDIAVTAEDSESAKGGAGIKVVSLFNADGSLESQTANRSVSRMRFKLALHITEE